MYCTESESAQMFLIHTDIRRTQKSEESARQAVPSNSSKPKKSETEPAFFFLTSNLKLRDFPTHTSFVTTLGFNTPPKD